MTTTNLIGRHQVLEKYDEVLLWITIALLVFGLVMVYSASLATAAASKFTGFQPAYYLIRHGLFIFIGVAAGVAAFQVSLQNWQKLAPYLFFLGDALFLQ